MVDGLKKGEGVPNFVSVRRPNPGFSGEDEGSDITIGVTNVKPGDVVLQKPVRIEFVSTIDENGRAVGWK